MSIAAIILAGGLGARMGGADKGLMLMQQRPLVQHVIERLKPQVDNIMINANRHLETYRQFGYAVLPDQHVNFLGPLAGFQAGLKYSRCEYLLTCPCDTPLLPENLVQILLATLKKHHAEIAIAATHGNDHPVICLCKTSVLSSLEAYLDSGVRKVSDWQKKLIHAYADFTDQADAFANINTPEELTQLSTEQ